MTDSISIAAATATAPIPRAPRAVRPPPLRKHLIEFSVALAVFAAISFFTLRGAGFPALSLRFEPGVLLGQGVILPLHVGSALAAFGLGTLLMSGPKSFGRTAHRWLGWSWVSAMGLTAASSFFLTGLNGHGAFSWIHGLSAITLIGLPMGVAAIRQKKLSRHATDFRNLYVRAMLIAGLFTFLPGRTMWSVFLSAG